MNRLASLKSSYDLYIQGLTCKKISLNCLQWKRPFHVDASKAKNGIVVSFNNKLCVLEKKTHHAQGRSGGHYKLYLRDLKTGNKIVERVNTSASFEGKVVFG